MIGIPLPRNLAEHLAIEGSEGAWSLAKPGTNLSLVYDRGYKDHAEPARDSTSPKQRFLDTFAQIFQEGDLEAFTERRRRVMTALGARSIRLENHSRLVIGLGLPSPLETGFLLDRFRGCPYLPGSSIKGLARVAASLVAEGELEGDREFWKKHLERIFGPPLDGEHVPAKGRVIFYDAFPETWPRLVVDVLTPHFGDYYSQGAIPGDWEEPVPVPFLTVEVGCAMTFYFRALDPERADSDTEAVRAVLELGLEELGIGGKKSSGYGVFSTEPAPELPKAPEPSKPKHPEPPPPKTRKKIQETLWQNSTITRGGDGIETRRGGSYATGDLKLLDKKTQRVLKKRKEIVADVWVVPGVGKDKRISRIEKVNL